MAMMNRGGKDTRKYSPKEPTAVDDDELLERRVVVKSQPKTESHSSDEEKEQNTLNYNKVRGNIM